MKLKETLIMATIILIISFGTIAQSGAGETYDLNGEWDTVITYKNDSGYIKTEKDVIKISQQGNQFVGTRTIGGKFVGKNEEEIKGKLLDQMVDEAFVNYPIDQVTFDLTWNEGRATLTEGGNKIVIQSLIRGFPCFVTITLSKKQ